MAVDFSGGEANETSYIGFAVGISFDGVDYPRTSGSRFAGTLDFSLASTEEALRRSRERLFLAATVAWHASRKSLRSLR